MRLISLAAIVAFVTIVTPTFGRAIDMTQYGRDVEEKRKNLEDKAGFVLTKSRLQQVLGHYAVTLCSGELEHAVGDNAEERRTNFVLLADGCRISLIRQSLLLSQVIDEHERAAAAGSVAPDAMISQAQVARDRSANLATRLERITARTNPDLGSSCDKALERTTRHQLDLIEQALSDNDAHAVRQGLMNLEVQTLRAKARAEYCRTNPATVYALAAQEDLAAARASSRTKRVDKMLIAACQNLQEPRPVVCADPHPTPSAEFVVHMAIVANRKPAETAR